MRFKTIPYSPVQAVEPTSDILSVHLDEGRLTVKIAKSVLPSGGVLGAEVVFSKISGMRFLDEADLSRYWTSENFLRGAHVLRVEQGGWADEENSLAGYSIARREWLVVTGNGCLSVLARELPSYNEVQLESNA